MAVKERIYQANEIYFLTFTILGWRNVFVSEAYINLIYKWFNYINKEYGNKVHGYVIMPNHFHGLIYISEKSPNISRLIQNAKRFLAYEIIDLLEKDDYKNLLEYFAIHAEINKGSKNKVFTDGFDALIIQSQKLFLEKLNYIHYNPCQPKWNLAENPEDYLYSSANNYIHGSGIYNVELVDF